MTGAVGIIGRFSANARGAGRRIGAAGGGFALWAFAIRVGAAALAFLTQIVLARLVGEEAYGEVAGAITVLGIVVAVAVLGLDTAAQRFVARYRVEGDDAALRGFVQAARVLPILVGGAVGSVGVVLTVAHDQVLALAFVMLPFVAALLAQEGVAKSFDWPILALGPTFLLRPVLALGFVLAAAALGMGLDARGVMLAMLAAAALALGLQTLVLAPRLARTVPAGASRYHPRTWLAIVSPIVVGDIGALVASSVDVLALALTRPAEETGIYFAAVKSLALVQFVSYAIANAVAHRVSALHVAGDRLALRRYVLRACLATFVPSLALALVLVGLGEFVLGLFGEAFVAARPAMAIVAAGAVVLAAVGPAERVLNMIGAERACAVVYVVTAVVATALAFTLAPAYGVLGAASALALTMVFEAVALAVVLRAALR
ncbi:lipopolysaccharide biosynthesis protein [Salinarimonas chemoclinalis]|uniref:lipopolysaccharide biosynthesis protein n=1 Tax=Salinarimonas chemoclinalis TaxID=3241599 RepID=UPI0035563614